MRRTAAYRLAGVASTAVLLLAAGAAQAQLGTCVEVTAAAGVQPEALARIVRTEVDRHPTHRALATGDRNECQSHLSIEVVDLGAQGGRWVTGRINAQVPHREKIEADGLVPAIDRLLKVLLHNDPLVLRGPESSSWAARQKRALELRSFTHFGLEVFELGARVGPSFQTLPGLAVVLRREVSALHVGVRLGGAFDPSSLPGELRLRTQVDAQVEAAVYSNPSGATSLFAAALIGLVYHRFAGPATFDGPGATGIATSTGLSLALKGGIEAMRTSDVRVLAFLQLQAPAFVSEDHDHGVVDHWVPTASLGAGVLF